MKIITGKMGGGRRLKTGKSLNPWRSIGNIHLLRLLEKTTLGRMMVVQPWL